MSDQNPSTASEPPSAPDAENTPGGQSSAASDVPPAPPDQAPSTGPAAGPAPVYGSAPAVGSPSPPAYGQAPPGQPPYPGQVPPVGYPPAGAYPVGPLPVYGKSKMAAGLLGVFLGVFGVHNFYLGFTGKAVAQLLITVLSLGTLAIVSWIWGLVEGIMILSAQPGTPNAFDANGVPLTP